MWVRSMVGGGSEQLRTMGWGRGQLGKCLTLPHASDMPGMDWHCILVTRGGTNSPGPSQQAELTGKAERPRARGRSR
jgi:hypothetical protein